MWHAYLQSTLIVCHWPAEMKSWPDFRPALPRPPPTDRDSRQQLKDNRQPIHVIHLTELRPHKIHLTAALEPFQQPNQICPEASLSLTLGWAGPHFMGMAASCGLCWAGAGQGGGPRLVANGEMIAFYDLIKLDTNRSVDVYLSLSLMLSLPLSDSYYPWFCAPFTLFLATALMRVLVLWDIFMRSTRPKLLS